MNIGIDTHAAEQDGTGNATYVRGLVEGLLALPGDRHRFVLYALDEAHPWYARLRHDDRLRVRVLRPASPVPRLLVAMPVASVCDRLDVLHVQYVGPLLHRGALVVTVHDLAFESHGETFPALLRARLRWQVRREVGRADAVVTGSEASARDIAQRYGCEAARLHVVRYGIDARFHDVAAEWETQIPAPLPAVPYLLSVGRLNPRKNLAGLLAAFEILRRERPAPLRLVIAGPDDFASASVREAITASAFRDDIALVGCVGDDEIVQLYRSAAAFVFPSFHEGFGLPPLEAMACSAPVVASGRGSLAEVLGDAAVLVDPDSPSSIAAGIARVLDDEALAARLREAGRARAGLYSWKAAAAGMLEVYERAARRRSRR